MQKQSNYFALVALLSLAGCAVAATEDDELFGDSGPDPILIQMDGGAMDASLLDAELPADAFVFALPDATLDDAAAALDGGRDAGRDASVDAGRADAGRADAGRPDASLSDASRPDGSLPDASADASRPDASTGGSCKVDSCPACSDGKDRCCVADECGCKYLFNSICLPE